MSRSLSGVTHAIVTIPYRKDAEAAKAYAFVDLCFGPGNDTAISGLTLAPNAEGLMSWQVPMYEAVRDGRTVLLPVFKGALLLETTKLAAAAMDRIKKEVGKPLWGHRYSIFKDQVLVEDLPKE